ncbi:MAG TPA: pitrilysin family protein [Candidatus Kryptonia bacterium]|nr:pitrilysin family protein [Candidatus Kryptonia bacterium]
MGRAIAAAALTVLAGSIAARATTVPAAYSRLSNGVTLIVSEQHTLPIVAVQVMIDAGARLDPPRKAGVAALTADLLNEGTAKRSATEISDAIDFIGGALETAADTDSASIALSVLSKDLDTGIDLLSDILMRPAFREEEVARRREAALGSIREAEDQPGTVASKAFQETLFGNGPYGHPAEGTRESVAKLTRADVVDFYHRYYRPGRTIVTVVGDVTAGAIAAQLEKALATWTGGAGEPFQYPAEPPPAKKLVTIDKPLTQANIILGHRGIARDNPDYYAVTVMNYVLGAGGFSSRLLDNIRTQGGLAYSVASVFSVNKSPGSFQVVMQTKNPSAADAIARARAEINRIRREPITDDELSEAKRYLTGSFPLKLDSTRKIAGFLAQVEFYGLGRDYADSYAQRINAITKDDVLRVAQQYLKPEDLILVVVGKLSETPLSNVTPATGTEVGGDSVAK